MMDREDDLCWMTEDGRVIPVCDLDPNHMRNIIRFILGRKSTRITLRKGLHEHPLRVVLNELPDPIDEDRNWGKS